MHVLDDQTLINHMSDLSGTHHGWFGVWRCRQRSCQGQVADTQLTFFFHASTPASTMAAYAAVKYSKSLWQSNGDCIPNPNELVSIYYIWFATSFLNHVDFPRFDLLMERFKSSSLKSQTIGNGILLYKYHSMVMIWFNISLKLRVYTKHRFFK